MSEAEWFGPLLQGLIALLAAGVLFALARARFGGKGGPGAGGDVGLD